MEKVKKEAQGIHVENTVHAPQHRFVYESRQHKRPFQNSRADLEHISSANIYWDCYHSDILVLARKFLKKQCFCVCEVEYI